MKNKVKLYFFILLFIVKSSAAQHVYYSNQQLASANTAMACDYLSSEEKNLIFYINLLRTSPKIFLNNIAKHYLDSAKFADNNYIKSLQVYLNEAEPMPLLNAEKNLFDEALIHATDMGKTGLVGHNASNGNTFEKRFETLVTNYTIVQENCQYGYKNALDILMDLLIDDGIEDYGHRHTLMNTRLRFVGVAIRHHAKYKVNCVIDFGGKKID